MEYYLKNKVLIVLLLCITFASCNSKPEEPFKQSKKKTYEVYQPSEMAVLMQDFYTYNEQLKLEIIEGKELSEIPEEFLTIHTAKMTDSTGRNAIFNAYAPAYIQTQMAVLDSTSSLDLESRYNNAINMCLACHKTECVGPIPRIKKLLIQ